MNKVMIHKHECLSCKYLCELNEKEFPCYGKNFCPAKGYVIVLGLNMDKVSSKLADALATNDTAKIASITKKLSQYDTDIRDKVMQMAKQKSSN